MTNATLAQLDGQIRAAIRHSRTNTPAPGNLSTAVIARRFGITVEDVRRRKRALEHGETLELGQGEVG